MKKAIIGLIGVKQAGKSTASDIIMEHIPGSTESALADKLKNACAGVFGLSRKQLDLQELKEIKFNKPIIVTANHINAILSAFKINTEVNQMAVRGVVGTEMNTPRRIAQIVGTEILRVAGGVDVHCKNIDLSQSNIIVVSDVRFANEFAFFSNSKFDFVPLYIQRDLAESKVTKDSHISEREVFGFCGKCIKVGNNGSVKELKDQIIEIIGGYPAIFR